MHISKASMIRPTGGWCHDEISDLMGSKGFASSHKSLESRH